MSKREDAGSDENASVIGRRREADREDPLARSGELISPEIPPGVDRRTFVMRSAVIGATAVITGAHISAQERSQRATAPPPNALPTPLSSDLNVVKKQKGPVMTTL